MSALKLYKGFYRDICYLASRYELDKSYFPKDYVRDIAARIAQVEQEMRHRGTAQRPLGQLLVDAAESEAYGQPF